jgi:hypothetical protein
VACHHYYLWLSEGKSLWYRAKCCSCNHMTLLDSPPVPADTPIPNYTSICYCKAQLVEREYAWEGRCTGRKDSPRNQGRSVQAAPNSQKSGLDLNRHLTRKRSTALSPETSRYVFNQPHKQSTLDIPPPGQIAYHSTCLRAWRIHPPISKSSPTNFQPPKLDHNGFSPSRTHRTDPLLGRTDVPL